MKVNIYCKAIPIYKNEQIPILGYTKSGWTVIRYPLTNLLSFNIFEAKKIITEHKIKDSNKVTDYLKFKYWIEPIKE